MVVDFEIIVGTYEQFLLGYKIRNVDETYHMERSFATHSHLASIRAVASGKHYLASAGADDSVFLYDMRYRVESGRLMHHTDTINCIEFTPEASHLLTASSDGSIGIVRCGNWQLEKHWKAPHKGNIVNALAVHPTGKLAMSTGGDGVLRTWNLVKGRQAYATNLVPRLKLDAKNVSILRWSPTGEKYLLVSNCKLDVYSVATAGLCGEIAFSSKVVCVDFFNEDTIIVGHEDGKISIYNLTQDTNTLEIEAHDVRVKCLAHRDNYLVSASSSGEIKIWRYGKNKLNMLSCASCGVRITCLTLTQPCPDLTVKKEEPSIKDEVETRKKNVFRMRQEVTIEDEGEENSVSEIVNSKKKKNKKSAGRKRAAETLEPEESTEVSIKKKKNKKITISEIPDTTSKKKKISLSVEQTSPEKRAKKEITKVTAKKTSKNGQFNVDEMETSKQKKKKIKTKKIVATSIEKPSEPASNKRKQQNVTSSTTGFPTKIKKKKLAK